MACFFLDFRSDNCGGAVVPGVLDPAGGGLGALQLCGSVVFLIHGFNVDRAGGEAELGAFAALLPGTQGGAGVAVLWPGDSTVGPLSYPFETNKADDTAVELSKFISDCLPRRPSISFIAHSLGCRVAMETVRHLWIKDIPVAQVCLMAAAIDNNSLSLASDYRDASQHAERVAVLYSPCDRVLQYAYPAGNFASAFLHWTSTTNAALGYTGPRAAAAAPADVPECVAAVGIPAAVGADHGDYLPSATGPANPKQLAAASFSNGVLIGTVPLAYG